MPHAHTNYRMITYTPLSSLIKRLPTHTESNWLPCDRVGSYSFFYSCWKYTSPRFLCSHFKRHPYPTSQPSAHAALRGETMQLIHKYLTSDKRERVPTLPAASQETGGGLTCLVNYIKFLIYLYFFVMSACWTGVSGSQGKCLNSGWSTQCPKIKKKHLLKTYSMWLKVSARLLMSRVLVELVVLSDWSPSCRAPDFLRCFIWSALSHDPGVAMVTTSFWFHSGVTGSDPWNSCSEQHSALPHDWAGGR